jgi:hypothetical protein
MARSFFPKTPSPKPARIPPQTQYERIYWVLCLYESHAKSCRVQRREPAFHSLTLSLADEARTTNEGLHRLPPVRGNEQIADWSLSFLENMTLAYWGFSRLRTLVSCRRNEINRRIKS